MAKVRVFLPTFRRPTMLPRALKSLQAQTFHDWICEVHNDAPDDPTPSRVVGELGDARFVVIDHSENLGPVRTFNLFFRTTEEPFYSMLEDDNWWEPDFLASMLEVAASNPEATVFWANMRLWQELPDGSFRDTGRTVRPIGTETQRFEWGRPEQMLGAVHSNGAALFRSRPGDDFSIPSSVPFATVEHFRERILPFPLIHVSRPLANFAVTRQTARSKDHFEWAAVQVMLASAFLRHSRLTDSELREIWQDARSSNPPRTSSLLLALLLNPGLARARLVVRPIDWWRFLKGAMRRPITTIRVWRSQRTHPEWWNWLDRATAAQFAATRTANVPAASHR